MELYREILRDKIVPRTSKSKVDRCDIRKVIGLRWFVITQDQQQSKDLEEAYVQRYTIYAE